jgi:hypothetical protein
VCILGAGEDGEGEYRDMVSGKVLADQVTVPRLVLYLLVQSQPKAPKAH